ncbi:unnamed protein product [Paramecium primaurelia]|uniref:Uncharacterized protein n=1 Tax=Paramecium primaurelia TaxID=5886 RepID=A0A8S1M5J7_PARPR|nr:unnamed protein product [Paramecium primaurelia]
MPLLLICGPPASGKTQRAIEIQKFIKEKMNKESIIINEENLHLIKDDAYKDNTSEKMTRGFLKSNVEKYIQAGQLVIFDSINYIKGYRYELYCLARAAKTTNCLLYLNVPLEICQKNNENRENKFNDNLLIDLYKRMEIPKQKDRWECPYFEIRFQEKTPLDEMAEVLFYAEKTAKDPIATKKEQQNEGNFVHEQEKRVQDILDQIINKQVESLQIGNGTIKFQGTKALLILKRALSIIELKKLRLEFLNMLRITPVKTLEQTNEAFINFIQAQIERLGL